MKFKFARLLFPPEQQFCVDPQKENRQKYAFCRSIYLAGLFGEQEIDQLGGQNNHTDDGEDDNHAHAHVLQILDESHGIKGQIDRGIGKKQHLVNLP